LQTDRHIERFTAKAGGGSIRAQGDASFGVAPQATVTLTAERFQLLGRVDRRIVTSGQARLQFDARNVAVDGRFDVDEGLIDFSRSDAPALAADVEVTRAPSAAASAAATAQRAAAQAPNLPANTRRDVALDLRVGLGQKLRIRGHGLDTGLRGELHITSPGGRLAVNGTVQAVDGTYAAYGQKLGIDRGVIVFNGEVGNPRLDIEATRPNLDLRVGVAVTGTASSPRIRLFSEPELSEMDKLSWLVMGRASDGLGSADTALLQRAALALLSGEGGGLTEQFTKAIGLDELSVRQSQGEVRDTVVSVGKQLSQRWYVGYERGLNATAGSWQLIYRVARRFTLRAQSGEDNSLDVIWSWRWQ
jgi:translocation and assembly module TamB